MLRRAIESIERMRPDPRTAGVYINYAKALRFAGKLVEAEKYSGRAVELAPVPSSLITHAQVFAKAKRFGEAERVLFLGSAAGLEEGTVEMERVGIIAAGLEELGVGRASIFILGPGDWKSGWRERSNCWATLDSPAYDAQLFYGVMAAK